MSNPALDSGHLEIMVPSGSLLQGLPQSLPGRLRAVQCFSVLGMREQRRWGSFHSFSSSFRKKLGPIQLFFLFNSEKLFNCKNVMKSSYLRFQDSLNVNIYISHTYVHYAHTYILILRTYLISHIFSLPFMHTHMHIYVYKYICICFFPENLEANYRHGDPLTGNISL